jgi:acyl-CoA synthetase (AMP-forming)/AMP-acid ligase II
LGKIVDVETGKALPRNQEGEVLVKGPQLMEGYLDNEKATQETINSDGWLHTGDIGYVDDDGCFYIVDRLKELIKVKGLQVAPSELENLLRKLPGVADCAVIGIPSDSSGELPRAYIVKGDTSLSSDDVTGYIKKKVAPFKQLAGGVEFVDAIPKAATGKILRRELKRNYLESKGKK